MPKRLQTENEAKSVHTRKDGFTYEYYNPHSPFQRLINSAMERKQLSLRDITGEIEVAPSTLWLWLHNKKGFPTGRSFDSKKHIPALSRILQVPQEMIKKSLDLSKLEFSEGLIPDPMPLLDAFGDFITIVERMPGRNVSKDKLLNLARRLYAGASVEIEEAPMSRAPEQKSPATKKKAKPSSKATTRKQAQNPK